ncbi:hypothetical protein BB559_000453 [Furculomyces boomerangus]|uniref:sphinganine-1-phosphate aldolase n=1 Tax=Furculomyces boomerangus TaxID=61424 RepID=A0A2T9Z558_9FUNG|nr:hypothetical protein BB559_000453 [Furculomyces boomerangus]
MSKILDKLSGFNLNHDSFARYDKMRLFGQIMAIYYGFACIYSFGKSVSIYGFPQTISSITNSVLSFYFKVFKSIPGVQGIINSKVDGILKEIELKITDPEGKAGIEDVIALPQIGFSEEKIMEILQKRANEGKIDWESGKVSGAIYHGGADLVKLTNKAIGIFNISNPLHPDVFPGLRRMEAEIVSMTLNLFNAPKDACGVTTSGGTESIIMAVRAHLQLAAKERNVTHPNMIAPITIHTAFNKACEYFGVKLILIPIDKYTGKVNVTAIAGSAVNYPHGVMDDIEQLADIAKRNGIGMHVDCCLGSFIMPFMEDAGFKVGKFDFRVPGVTSISCDTHKYGFAPKGSSVVMYSNKKLRHYQYFVCTKWPGGIYASPTIAGSRPGSLIAGCWAAMTSIGKEGYIKSCKDIVGSRIKIQKGIESIKELRVIGEPASTVVAFTSVSPLNIYSIQDAMTARGWGLSTLQYPPALHIACTRLTVGVEDMLINDLKESIKEIKENPEKLTEGTAVMYGMASALPDQAPVEDITRGFLDALFKI